MPTYCIPVLSGVPGSPANEFDWWTLAPDAASLRFSPENPNWLGALSLSEGAGANRDMQFRALRGTVGGQPHLFLSWVIRVASLDTAIDRVNIVLGDGTNYVAFRAQLGTTSSTPAGTQDAGICSYRMHNCGVSAGVLSLVNPGLTVDGSVLETTGRMWVDVTSPQRGLQSRWAFQVAIPLGAPWAPSALNLPASGAFKLWYEVWTSLLGRTVPYQVPTTPASVKTTSAFQLIPTGLQVAHMLDMSTGTTGCTEGVTLNWGNVGVRNVAPADPPRTDTTSIRLDLGQNYPPNLAAGAGPLYNESQTPNVSASQYQNQFYAQPVLPSGLTAAQQGALRARFSLANWGSQTSIPTASSWRPVPGGEDAAYQTAFGEMRFVWPLPGPSGTADSFTTTLVRNINKYLNAVGRGTALPADAQSPHQCMLVEVSSTDLSVVITRSSIYQNMNVARASVFSRLAEISVVGLNPISSQMRDVYLYVQAFNLPKVAKDVDRERIKRSFGERSRVVAREGPQTYEVEDLAAIYPTYIVHVYHDTGETMKLEDGREVPILRPQTAFGYFAIHEGDLYGWETRLYGAEKIAENFYRVRVSNNGSKYVETAIQARTTASEEPLPETKIVQPVSRCADNPNDPWWLRLLKAICRFIMRLLGR